MTKAVPWIIGIIGLVFIGLATVYWLTPADGLPRFLPGFKPDPITSTSRMRLAR